MRFSLILVSAVLTGCGGDRPAQADRQAEVAARGAEVMPFDLDKTHHVFAKDSAGGVQTVTAKDAADSVNIRLIREHLQHEAERFSRGEFGDPAAIHGEEMPGLAELRASSGRIAIEYSTLPAGARLRYTTSDAALRSALHRWFDAQVADHGEHARQE